MKNNFDKPGVSHPAIGALQLRQAISNGDIRPAFQAKAIRNSDGSWAISETEALARWHRSNSDVVLPGQFLGIAEQAGLLPALTNSMLEQVIFQLRDWDSRGLRMCAAVNISASCLTNSAFPDELDALMKTRGLENTRLILELTESAAVQNEGLAMEILSRLRIKGFGLSIDDFGTGYSSLEQLYRLPFNELKIDRFLVREIGIRREAEIIVEAIIKLAQKLKLAVCAEGVESPQIVNFLLKAGCGKLQGYYLGRPSSAEDLEDRVRSFRRTGFGSDVLAAARIRTRRAMNLRGSMPMQTRLPLDACRDHWLESRRH